VLEKGNWPEFVALTGEFSVELSDIEVRSRKVLTPSTTATTAPLGAAGSSRRSKNRETGRMDLG
jgi:hypothetical protein